MRTTRVRLVLVLATAGLLAPSIAFAQPGASPPPPPPPPGHGYYAQPPASPYYYRQGFTIGFGLGIGGMSSADGSIDCYDCDVEPAALGFDFHIGGLLNPRLALLLELSGTGQQLDYYGDEVLVQSMALFAAQYWVTPRLWLKGGIGVSDLSVSYSDGYSDTVDSGGALLGAVGYEIISAPNFGLDLSLRLATASYEFEDSISSGLLGVGFNWY